jgi:hypothetical protein
MNVEHDTGAGTALLDSQKVLARRKCLYIPAGVPESIADPLACEVFIFNHRDGFRLVG